MKGYTMPVRGTTAWKHAIIQKKIINRDEGGYGSVTSSGTHYVICAWSDCERDATTLYSVRERTHAPGINDNDPFNARFVIYAFCSEKCKQNWLEELARSRRLTRGG